MNSGTKPEDFERIFEKIPIGIVYIDRDFRVLRINPYFEKKLGMKLEQVRGIRCYEIKAELSGEKKKGLKHCGHCLVPESIEKDEVRTFVNEVTPDLILENTTVPVKDESGTIIGAIELLQDITEKTKMEKQLREYSENLEKKVETKTKELALLQKVNNLLNSGADPREVYEVIAEGLTSVFHYQVSGIYVLSEDRTNLICTGYHTESEIAKKIEQLAGIKALDYHAPLFRDSILTKIIETKKPVITRDIAGVVRDHTDKSAIKALANAIAKISGVKWGMGVPLLAGEKVVGVIGTGSREELTDEDASRLARFGDQVGMALEKSRISKDLEKRVLERTSELTRQKELIERITEGIDEGIFLLGKDRRIQWANSKLKEQIRCSDEEILGKHCYEVTHKRKQKCAPPNDACPIESVIETGRPATEIHVHYDKGGNESFVEVTAYPMKENGEVTSYVHITRDITERKRMEDALRESEAKYRTMVEHSNDLIWTLDKEGNFTYFNKQAEEVSGYKLAEWLGKSFAPLIPSSDISRIKEIFLETLNGKSQQYEVSIYRKDGAVLALSVNTAPILESGKIVGTVSFARDITERRKAEEELKMLKDFNENIVKSMEEGILIENDEGYVTFANPRMLEMLGGPKGEIIGKHWTTIFSSDSEKTVMEENARLIKGGKSRYEAVLNLGNKELQVMVSATPLMEGDFYAGNLKVFVDITEKKEAEDKLRQKAQRYKVEKSKSYLITEKVLEKGMDVFKDLLQAGYKGMMISRTPPEVLAEIMGEKVEVLWLSEKKKGKGVIPPQLNLVKKSVEDFASRNSVVLLDRLDYLIVRNGFNDVLKLLQELNEMMYLAKAVLLVVMDPEILAKHEFSLMEKEFLKVEAKYQVELDEGLLEMMKFVKKERNAGRTPVHKDIASAFGITRPTAVKKLKELKNKGLLIDKKRGRFKTLELTDRGMELV